MNIKSQLTERAGPINQEFIVQYVHSLLLESNADPDLRWLYPLIRSAVAESALIHTYGNQVQAAALLGLHKETLRRYYMAYRDWQNNAIS